MKSDVKKIIICLIAILMVMVVATKTLATDGNKNIGDMLNEMKKENQNSTINGTEEPDDIESGNRITNTNMNTDNNKNFNVNENQNENKNENENKPTTTPYTGIGDYSVIVFIVIFAISAVYAYKKIRDYNV